MMMVICILAVYVLPGCGNSERSVTVGSKNFTEQIILGEIMSQLIESRTDLKVNRKFNLGGTFVCFSALQKGYIDIYPEYTGTGLIAILKEDVLKDPDRAYAVVKGEFKKRYDLVWLEPFGLNNTYTITLRKADAEKRAIKNISDLLQYRNILRAGFTSEFLERPDGYRGLKKKYGLKFKIRPKELDPGLMYRALKEKQIDVICGFATDGRIPAYNLKALRDDKNFFPPYFAAPLIRQKTIDAYPELPAVINKLDSLISDAEMRAMNYAVDQKGIKAKDVARKFLIKVNLLK